jgi:hypothetical protein
MAGQKQGYASMDPETFSQGGGLFDDVDAIVTEAKFTAEPPEGYNPEGNPLFFVLGLHIDGMDEPVSQSYSMGAKAGDNFEISEDGLGLIPNGPASKLGASSKFGLFMGALKTEGFPIADLSGENGMGALVGLRAHFNRMPDPERKGLKTGGKEKKYPETTLVVTKIHTLPGEQQKPGSKAGGKKGASAPAASSKTAAAKGAGNAEDIEAAESALVSILAAKGGSVQKSQLPLLAVKELAKNPRKQEIAKIVYSEEFLSRENEYWEFDATANPQVVTAK